MYGLCYYRLIFRDGPRTGLQGAKDLFGADEALPISDFPVFLQNLTGDTVYTDLDLDKDLVEQTHIKFNSTSHAASSPDKDPSISSFIMNSLRRTPSQPAIMDLEAKRRLSPLIQPLRCIKTDSEISVMRKACQITSESFKEVSISFYRDSS